MAAIETTGLTKSFGKLVAVSDLNLHVAKGTIFGFLGPNGSGKSTTVKLLTGLLKPDRGDATICGISILTSPLEVKKIIRSKNVAFLLVVSLQLVPLFILGLWSLELTVVILGFIEAILLALAYMTWGNFLSISHRFQMQFFRFSSGGSPIDALVGVLFGTVPGAVAILLFGRRLWWATVAMVVFYSAFYLLSLSWSGKRFNRIIEQT